MYIKPKGEMDMFDNGMRMQKAREVHEWANKEIKALKEEAINAISSAKMQKNVL